MEMVCNVGDLMNICRLVSLKGKNPQGKESVLVPDFMIKASAGILEVFATDKKNALSLWLRYDLYSINEEGNLPVVVEEFLGNLKRFNAKDIITIKTFDNKISMGRKSPKRDIVFPASLEIDSKIANSGEETISRFPFINGYPKSNKTHLSLKITVDATKIRDISKECRTNEYEKAPFEWVVDGKTLSINLCGSDGFKIENDVEVEKIESDPDKPRAAGTKTSFSYGFDNLFANLDGIVEIYLVDGVEICPLYLVKKIDRLEFRAILAPLSME